MSIRDKLISGPLGFGAAPLGNMFRNIPAAQVAATVHAAWQQGIRYFDTAPLCGAGNERPVRGNGRPLPSPVSAE
jgi:D-threo-aldose 1-dehydrogenase